MNNQRDLFIIALFTFITVFCWIVADVYHAVTTSQITEEQKKGLLINPPLWQYNGSWVLVPKDPQGFGTIHAYFGCVLENKSDCQTYIDKED